MYPQYIQGIDKSTGSTKINTDAILAQIGTFDGLTQSQRDEVAQLVTLDGATKKSALASIALDIQVAESQYSRTAKVITCLNVEKQKRLDLNNLTSSDAHEMVGNLLFGDKNRKKAIQDNSDTYSELLRLRALYDAVANSGSSSPDDTLLASPSSGSKSASDTAKDATKEFIDNLKKRSFALADLDHQIEMHKALADSIDDTTTKGQQDKVKELQTLSDLEIKRQKATLDYRKLLNDSMYTLNLKIDKYISGWSKLTAEQKMKAVNNLSVSQKEKVNDLVDAWDDLNNEMKQSESDAFSAGVESNKYLQDARDNIEALYKKGLEYQKSVQQYYLELRQADAKENLQYQEFNSTLDEYETHMQNLIDLQQTKLDNLDEEIDKEEYLNNLRDKEAEIAKVKADTRFAYIDEATGKEIYTYDRAKVTELEKDRQNLVTEESNNQQKKAIQDEIDRLKNVEDTTKKSYETRLKALEEWQTKENEAFAQGWDDKLSDESVNAYVLEIVRQNGYHTSLSNVQQFLTKYKGQNQAIKEPTKSIWSSLESELGNIIDNSSTEILSKEELKIQESLAKWLEYKKSLSSLFSGISTSGGSGGGGGSNNSVVAQMMYNSSLWSQANDAGKSMLHDTNEKLGESIGASYDSGSGTWKDSDGNRIFHNGGFVGRYAGKNEVVAKLLEGEYVISNNTLDRLSNALPQTLSGGTNETTSSQSVNIHIDKIEADNFNDMMDSLQPYITANR